MNLTKVEYEFFEFEEPSATTGELRRQLRLHFADAPTLFLSWTWERQHCLDDQPYSIGHSTCSCYLDEPAAVIDASDTDPWSRHLGCEVAVGYQPSTLPAFEYQIIEVRSVGDPTFVFSMGDDRVWISDASPNPEDAGAAMALLNGNTA